MIKDTKVFGLSYLTNDQNKLAGQFGFNSGRNMDKFEKFCSPTDPNTAYFTGSETGVRLFSGSISTFELKLVNEVPAGDHSLLIGELVKCHRGSVPLKESLHCVGPTICNILR